MKEIIIESKLTVFDNLDELSLDIVSLMDQAATARNNSYSPYSEFSVGAAVLLDNNKVILGSNQENASYPSGLCAERTAIFYANSQYPKSKILKMAIVAGSRIHRTMTPIPPCGACRQTIVEYEVKQNTDIEIYFMGETGEIIKSHSIANLLPLVFDNSVL